MPLAVDTSGRLYDDFIRLFLLYVHREEFALDHELSEESDQFRFLHTTCLTNLKGSVGLIMSKTTDMWISIPLHLSSLSLIPILLVDDSAVLDLVVPLPLHRPPKKKTSTTYPKRPPLQISSLPVH